MRALGAVLSALLLAGCQAAGSGGAGAWGPRLLREGRAATKAWDFESARHAYLDARLLAGEQTVADAAYRGLERVDALERLWAAARERVVRAPADRRAIYAERTRALVAAIDARLAGDDAAAREHAGRALAFNPFDPIAKALLAEDIAVRTLLPLRNAYAPVISPEP